MSSPTGDKKVNLSVGRRGRDYRTHERAERDLESRFGGSRVASELQGEGMPRAELIWPSDRS
jgi:hypothetical protein